MPGALAMDPGPAGVGRAPAGTMGLELLHVVAGQDRARLLFAGDFRAEIARADWEGMARAEEFAVEIPPPALRLIKS